MEQYRESHGRKYDYCIVVMNVGSKFLRRTYCQATIDGKRQREEAVIGEEELQMMMDDDDFAW
jgi:hypothetical protein